MSERFEHRREVRELEEAQWKSNFELACAFRHSKLALRLGEVTSRKLESRKAVTRIAS
jgi:hypothetical protein